MPTKTQYRQSSVLREKDLRGDYNCAYLHIYGPSHASWESKGVSSYRVLNITQNEQVKEEPPNCFQELLIVLPFSLINRLLCDIDITAVTSTQCKPKCTIRLLTPGGSKLILKNTAQSGTSKGRLESFLMALRGIKLSFTVTLSG